MRALQKEDDHIRYNIHNCITCRQCTLSCPTNAITFGTGERGWESNTASSTSLKEQTSELGA